MDHVCFNASSTPASTSAAPRIVKPWCNGCAFTRRRKSASSPSCSRSRPTLTMSSRTSAWRRSSRPCRGAGWQRSWTTMMVCVTRSGSPTSLRPTCKAERTRPPMAGAARKEPGPWHPRTRLGGNQPRARLAPRAKPSGFRTGSAGKQQMEAAVRRNLRASTPTLRPSQMTAAFPGLLRRAALPARHPSPRWHPPQRSRPRLAAGSD